MSTRRGFIGIFTLAGLSQLPACSDKAAPPPTLATTSAVEPAPPPATMAVAAQSPAAESLPITTPAKVSGAGPMVDAGDSLAVALGYLPNSAKVDATKYPNHSVGQACANCALYIGKPGDASGPCPLFAGKQVSAAGWCSGYTKKV